MRRERATGSSATPNGKKRLAGDTAREATSDEVKGLRKEAVTLKEVVAELTLEMGRALPDSVRRQRYRFDQISQPRI